jgi:hypothetical protein
LVLGVAIARVVRFRTVRQDFEHSTLGSQFDIAIAITVRGWTFYPHLGQASSALATTAPRTSYYALVGQHNKLGLGNDVPIATDDALVGGNGYCCASPYPLSVYAKSLDGRRAHLKLLEA